MSGWVAGATVAAAGIGAYASNKASKDQARALREGAAAEERMYNRGVELQEPFRQVGVNALPDLVAASKYDPFTLEKFRASPGYAFRLKEGLRAIENSALASGMGRSGSTLRGLTRYGQELGSEEFMNEFNRYLAEGNTEVNRLQSLTGMGQTAANTLTNQAGQYGQSLASNAATMGNIRASGYMGTANALTNALGQGVNYYQNQQMMDRYFGRPNAPRPDFSKSPYQGRDVSSTQA
jgi:hypothetical protein